MNGHVPATAAEADPVKTDLLSLAIDVEMNFFALEGEGLVGRPGKLSGARQTVWREKTGREDRRKYPSSRIFVPPGHDNSPLRQPL
jgi:hypothetical protein